jgi:predicted Zn-dependent protease
LLALEDPRKALVAARGFLEFAPLDPRAADLMARVYLALGEPVDAAAMFRRAVALAPTEPAGWLRLAGALGAAGDQAGARAALEEAVRARPAALASWSQRVAFAWREGGPDAALRVAEDLRARHPEATAGDLTVGDVMLAAGDRAGAMRAYVAAFSRAPDSETAARIFDLRVEAPGGAAEAPAFARDWLRRHPADVAMRHRLAALALRAGRDAEAIAELEALIAIAPGDVAALNNLAWLLAARGDAQAVLLAGRAHALAPGHAAVADTYGLALVAAGRSEEAAGILRQALALSPASAQLRYRLATALAAAGHREEAHRLVGAALDGGDAFAGRAEALGLAERLAREGRGASKTPLEPRARGG